MPRGSKAKYTEKQTTKAEHIEKSYEAKGVPKAEAQARAWATVNKQSGGGERSGGSGRHTSGESKQKARQASAHRAAQTRKGVPRPDQPLEELTKTELLDKARKQHIAGRSTMRKAQLIEALHHAA
ncbi:Rho termination factor N-terminal domain-containing protein [Pseudomonas sp. Pseusp122]|uniref:Rho termination factor N-terminal domain-containing protein n=1 Tax=unclassified Pseudomonas TaxID=196821 RepID=UPI0039A6755C